MNLEKIKLNSVREKRWGVWRGKTSLSTWDKGGPNGEGRLRYLPRVKVGCTARNNFVVYLLGLRVGCTTRDDFVVYLGEGGVYGQGGLRCLLKLKIVCTATDVFVYYPLGSRWVVPWRTTSLSTWDEGWGFRYFTCLLSCSSQSLYSVKNFWARITFSIKPQLASLTRIMICEKYDPMNKWSYYARHWKGNDT